MEKKELVIKGLPSSFVARELKLAKDKGAGEAKLFIGSTSNSQAYDDFFEFAKNAVCYFDKDNLLLYLQQTKIEYAYQSINQYKNINLESWKQKYTEIESMDVEEFKFNLTKFADASRYYIRTEEHIFKDVFRRIALPKITNIVIEKKSDQKLEFVFRLELNLDFSSDRDEIEELQKDSGNEDTFKTSYYSDFERNRIIFGAPGTGKSYKLEEDRKELLKGSWGTYERVTFHPDYTYSNFVGTYKPVTDDAGEIRYEFVPGPFMRVYVDALKSGKSQEPQPHLLLIEEINRAKVAAVFGDVFQLLDRDDSGVSEYEIHATEDIRNYLAKELGGVPNDFDRIRIPDNMFIWATMNSADQGVFPMDTAFKRRWNFEYIGINNNEGVIQRKIMLGRGTHKLEVDYNKLRKAINDKLAKDFKVNEDKLIGPFFLSMEVLKTIVAEDEVTEYRVAEGKAIEYKASEDKDINLKKFTDAFKSKVIMYLYEDAAKQHKHKLFEGCESSKYSSVCEAFDEIGIDIFGDGFRELYNQQGV